MAVVVDAEQPGAGCDQVPKRPDIVRQETDWILSYYQQAGTDSEADNDEPSHDENQCTGARRAQSPGAASSDSNSAYSFEGDEHPSSPTGPKSSENDHERVDEVFGSPPRAHHQRKDDRERRNAGRRRSELSADRRRIAVIELSPILPLSARRGQRPNITNTPAASSDQPRCNNPRLDEKSLGFAFVAPPDASPAAYTNLTPPSSAPAYISTIPNSIALCDQDFLKHKRSVSDVLDTKLSPRKSPRDIGIVGQLDGTPSITRKTSHEIQSYFDIQGSKVPVFQTPHRSPMPSPNPEAATVTSQEPSATCPGLLTPEIGEAKDIHKPVVGPVVVDANGAVRDKSGPFLTPTFSPALPKSYLHYQPGVHSIAGPPPPLISRPNRTDNGVPMSPPPRPPRMGVPTISASSSNSNLRLTREKSLSSPAPKPLQLSLSTNSTESSSANDQDSSGEDVRSAPTAANDIVPGSSPLTKPFHTREGAFPPSTIGSVSPTLPPELALESSASSIPSSSPSDESIPPPTPHKDDPLPVHVRSPSRSSTSTSRSYPPHPPRSRPVSAHNKVTDLPHLPLNTSESPAINEKSLPSPTVGALFAKRFSALPRAPSIISSSSLSRRASRTPSPPVLKRRKRVIEQWPVAMQFKDVLECKTPLERSLGYAHKINELAMYDSGLTSWMDAVKARALPKRPSGQRNSKSGPNLNRQMPSSYKEPPEERKVSQNSFESGVTFPLRPDAYSATDLSTKANDLPVRIEDLVTKAPSLPYPSLAPMTRSSTQNSTLTSPPSTMRSLPIPLPLSASRSAGGFFSSLGRKASVKKDKRPPSPTKTSSKKPSPPPQKPIQLPPTSTPHIIGGPRAIPGRSHSIVAQSAARPEETKKPADPKRRSTVGGRPLHRTPPSNKSMPPPPNTHSHNTHHISMPPPSHKQSQVPGQTALPDPQFNLQLDKLVHLLPQANRNVLAGYLRRSGQDILAVGRYLEDEKNGAIMYH